MYKVVICDDEREIVTQLSEILSDYYGDEVVTLPFTTAFAATDYIFDVAKGNVDILVMDIDLNGDNGIETAELIKQSFPHIKVIFMTAFINYARDIFEADPCFFIVKPLEENRVAQAIEKAISLIQDERQRCISIVTRGEIRNLQLSRIRYVESHGRTLLIREKNMDFEVYMKLNQLEEELPEHFLRCHQSYVVNLDYVKELTVDHAVLYSGETVPVSRSKYADTKKAFLQYLGQRL